MSHVLPCDEFPQAPAVAGMVAPSVRSELLRLFRALEGLGATPRVYGSFGWQLLTGLEYVSATSDLDLLLSASNPSNADDIARAMSAAQPGRLRLDGELRFPSGAAVAWREWLQWRARTVDRVLVKRLDGVAMVQDGACFEEACAEQGASGR